MANENGALSNEVLPTLLDADEIAAQLRTSKRQVYRWAAEHGLPAVRIGRTMLFDPRHVAAWLDERASGHPAMKHMQG